MIIQVTEPHYARDFALIYNSANTLFQEQERCDADETVFYKQLQEDQNFIYMEEDTICAFLSFHTFAEYHELTSLYVKREYQRAGIGEQLLTYFEAYAKKSLDNCCLIVKALRNAPWAIHFYQKHGYELLDDRMRRTISNWNLTEKAYEMILYKKRF
ncbi:MAG: GNAT family N-acetyltransferase [Lachnospiraceae bacterium]|nr:GNAT family N-acetyltransferase [Lachnospiraceae bacterium]